MIVDFQAKLTEFLQKNGATNIVIINDGGLLTLGWTATFNTPGIGELKKG
jgi:hypothetical protein